MSKNKQYKQPEYRQDNRNKERDNICEQYINEVLKIIYEDDYFDTRLSKASRIAFVAKSWGAIGGFHGVHKWCDECGKQFKHDELYSEGYHNSKRLCEKCNNDGTVNRRKH